MPRGIDRHSRRRFAAGERPFGNNTPGLCIELGDGIFGLDVYIHIAFAIDGGELRFAGELDGRDNFLRLCIDHAGVVAAAVECPNCLRYWFKDNAIRIGSGWD